MVFSSSVGICICRRPTNWGFSHCPIKVGRQRRSPRIYATDAFGDVFHKTTCRMHGNYIPRASIVAQSLTLIEKFARNFSLSRISADKRFLKNMSQTHGECVLAHPSLLRPRTGASVSRSAIAKLWYFFETCKWKPLKNRKKRIRTCQKNFWPAIYVFSQYMASFRSVKSTCF